MAGSKRTTTMAAVALGVVLTTSMASCTPARTEAPAPIVQQLGDPAQQPGKVSVGLRVLVLDDRSPLIAALVDRMTREGIPYDSVPLQERTHKPLARGDLATTDAAGVHAKYCGVIAPGLTSALLSTTERTLLSSYLKTFKVRIIETDAALHFPASTSPYSGVLDGTTVNVTPAGKSGVFSYLADAVKFDIDTASPTLVTLAAKPVDAVDGAKFTPLVTAPIPKSQTAGAVVGVLEADGRESMIASVAGNEEQPQTLVLAHGMLGWLTRGLATAFDRNYFSVHADDVLLPNAQWSAEGHCESGRNCPAGVPQPAPVRMTADDITFLVDWQKKSGIVIDLAVNGAGPGIWAASHDGRDPLMEAIDANKDALRVVSHTWSHAFLGCKQILYPDDWACQTAENGQPAYRTEEFLVNEISKNQAFLAKDDLRNYDSHELVTGEHSGLAKPPEMPVDNPNLAAALDATGIVWVASDASQEPQLRKIGSATTVPRYPFDLDYDVSTGRQAASQRNWLRTRKVDGGSGECELDPNNTCMAKIDMETGYLTTMVPEEAAEAFSHVVSNDARPYFLHQGNLANERPAYPLLDALVASYRATFATNAPLLNPTMTQAGEALLHQQNWAATSPDVTVAVSGSVVTVTNKRANAVDVPLTVPGGTSSVVGGRLGGEFGESYAGTRSGWVSAAPGTSTAVQLSGASGFATQASW